MKKLAGIALFVLLSTSLTYAGEKEVNSMLRPFVKIGGGSGTVIKTWKEDKSWFAYILTAQHVIDDDREPKITVYQFSKTGRVEDSKVTSGVIMHESKELDFAIAVCSIETKDNPFYAANTIAKDDFEKVSVFDKVYAVGCPNRTQTYVSEGRIGGFDLKDTHWPKNIVHSSFIHFGSSGGALYNDKGELIGINVGIQACSWNHQSLSNIGYSTPMSAVYKDLGSQSENFLQMKSILLLLALSNHMTYEEAIGQGQKENKWVLVMFTADWCGPCQRMKRDTLQDKEVKKYIAEKYVFTMIDIDSRRDLYNEKGRGEGIPDFAIINPHTGEVKWRPDSAGYMGPAEFLEWLTFKKQEKKKNETINRSTFNII